MDIVLYVRDVIGSAASHSGIPKVFLQAAYDLRKDPEGMQDLVRNWGPFELYHNTIKEIETVITKLEATPGIELVKPWEPSPEDTAWDDPDLEDEDPETDDEDDLDDDEWEDEDEDEWDDDEDDWDPFDEDDE